MLQPDTALMELTGLGLTPSRLRRCAGMPSFAVTHWSVLHRLKRANKPTDA
jgi:hypothetical protein